MALLSCQEVNHYVIGKATYLTATGIFCTKARVPCIWVMFYELNSMYAVTRTDFQLAGICPHPCYDS